MKHIYIKASIYKPDNTSLKDIVVHNTAENKLNQPKPESFIYGVPEGADAVVLAECARKAMNKDGVILHIALDDARVYTLEKLLTFFAPEISVVVFPGWDCLPYDRVSPNKDIVARRVAALCKINLWTKEKRRYPRIVLTNVNAVTQRVMPREALEKAEFIAKTGNMLDKQDLQHYLISNGYIRTDTVRESGEFSLRGGIVDLYPAGHECPVRIDLFGEEVESIKNFDPLSQRTQSKINEILLHPAREFFLDDISVSRFRANYRKEFGAQQKNNPVYEAVTEKRYYNGMEHWLPLFYDKMETLFDYIPLAEITCDLHVRNAYKKRVNQILDFYQARLELISKAQNKEKKIKSIVGTYNPLKPEKAYILQKEWSDLAQNTRIFSPFRAPEGIEGQDNAAQTGRNFTDVRYLPDENVFEHLKIYIDELHNNGVAVFVAAYSEGSRTLLSAFMNEVDIKAIKNITNYNDIKKLHSGAVRICIIPLENGFKGRDIAFISEQDILGDRLTRKMQSSRKASNFLTEVSSLAEGDMVVHADHGVGRFLELETIKTAGIVNDCLKIEYYGGDRLYVPVVNMDILSRYGSDDSSAQLDKLGGVAWQARKLRAKNNLMEIADVLLGIAAKRQLKKAPSLQISETLYNEFVAHFPYEETDDQERSIGAVLENMSGDYPMDHLVCGDVGYGKTEVAMRAAYVAAMSGVQVALVVPTTLLARQHYQNFSIRFKGTGVKIKQISRIVSASDVKRTKEGLLNGTVNIVIGTQALFAKDVKFSELGLLIVDEEQRFGVKQKEKLKEMKANIHVLTLTATPIPRTLQMSLTGVKEMSLITTPPVDRLAVRTFVMPLDTVVIRDALLREYYRGGQSFYVVPRIKDLKTVADMLRNIVPEISFIEAHGRLSSIELEERISAFYEGQYNILLATNIIESGIDIPSANTMVIHCSEMFGLAQLYQIRGRIGRSKQRAYAYLTYNPDKILTKDAKKRLEVIETLDALGSGFQLASYDMDIRGAGNLLGDAQSGHIREIGVELYQQMLEEAVAAKRAGITNIDDMLLQDWSPQINIGVSVMIPEEYVEDISVRMSLYRRLNGINKKQEIDAFAAELIDRFGALPDEVNNLLQILNIKTLCKIAGISFVEAGPRGALIAFYKDCPPNIEGLMGWISRKAGSVKIKPDQKLSIICSWQNPVNRIKGMQTILKELAALSPEE